MGFLYGDGNSGITVNGRDLAEFSAKLLTEYGLGVCGVETETFQGSGRSSVYLLGQKASPMEILLPLEFWGEDRADTVKKWSRFCGNLMGKVELDLQDGFIYHCWAAELGQPLWITDEWMSVEVKLKGMRHRETVSLTVETAEDAVVECVSTFPKTDCVVSLTVPEGTTGVSLSLGEQVWSYGGTVSAEAELVLNGVDKCFTLGGENIAGQLEWEDFPYLVPGENLTEVYFGGQKVTGRVTVTYRPTFL